jgi:hypothetical protein
LTIKLDEAIELGLEVPRILDVAVFVTDTSNRHRQSGKVFHAKIDAHQ